MTYIFLQSNFFDYHFFATGRIYALIVTPLVTPWVSKYLALIILFYLLAVISEFYLLAVNSHLGRFLSFHIGMAFLYGMCDPQKRCSVSQDNGLNVAFTVAHEIGHK